MASSAAQSVTDTLQAIRCILVCFSNRAADVINPAGGILVSSFHERTEVIGVLGQLLFDTGPQFWIGQEEATLHR